MYPTSLTPFVWQARALVVGRVVSADEDPLDGVDPDLLTVSRGMKAVLEQMSKKKKKKKKRGANKWQPFRSSSIYLLSVYLSILPSIYRSIQLKPGNPTLYFCYESKPLFNT